MKGKEIQTTEIWNDEKRNSLKEFITIHSQKQSKERKLRNELLAIQYRMEDYIETGTAHDKLSVLDFVKLYIKTFNVTQKKLAHLFEMKDSNLHKYLTGERQLNASLVLKLSSFSHLRPEYWLRVEVNNELMEITKEKERSKDNQKYDYINLLIASNKHGR